MRASRARLCLTFAEGDHTNAMGCGPRSCRVAATLPGEAHVRPVETSVQRDAPIHTKHQLSYSSRVLFSLTVFLSAFFCSSSRCGS